MIECLSNIICNIVLNTVKYGFHVFKFVKTDAFLYLADLCLDLGIGENRDPAGKSGSAFLFFYLDDRDRMFVEFLSSNILHLT